MTAEEGKPWPGQPIRPVSRPSAVPPSDRTLALLALAMLALWVTTVLGLLALVL